MEELSNSLNEFGVNLFRQIYTSRTQADENVIVSSISVVIAMMMALGGARNETASQIIESLGVHGFLKNNPQIEENKILLHESIRSLVRSVLSSGDESIDDPNNNNRIRLANRVILNSIKPNANYTDLIRSVYEADVVSIDPSSSSSSSFDKVAAETNRWVSDLTNGKIDSIVDADSLRQTSIALVNAIYFKQAWQFEFDEQDTRVEEFRVVDESNDSNGGGGERKVYVNMMHLEKKSLLYGVSETLGAHLLAVPYKNDKFVFNVVLPVDELDLLATRDERSLINRLLPSSFASLAKEMKTKMSQEKVNLAMPRFVIKKKMNLNDKLIELGMKSAFVPTRANFSGIIEPSNLFIQEVLQYAFIEVNEKGTEAAAATVVRLRKRSIEIVKSIQLNRPFIYFITETSSNLILFMGAFTGEIGNGSALLQPAWSADKTEL